MDALMAFFLSNVLLCCVDMFNYVIYRRGRGNVLILFVEKTVFDYF
jgi:hypothetical protein